MDPTAGLTLDPVRRRLLVTDHTAGRVQVVDTAGGTVARSIQVVGWLADPCENCLGSIGTPVVDLTTGLPTGPGQRIRPRRTRIPPKPRRPPPARCTSAGLAPTRVRIVPAGFGTSVLYEVDPAAGRVTWTIGVPAAAGSTTIDPSAGVLYLPVMNMPQTGVITTGPLPVGIDSLAAGAPIPVTAGSAGSMQFAVGPTTGQVWVAGDAALTVLG